MTDEGSNYERWVGDAYKVPLIGSRPRPPRGWPVVVLGCVVTWIAVVRSSPLAEGWRVPAAIALLVTGSVITIAILLTMLEVAERVHRKLLARPDLGDWRVLLWLGAFAGWGVLCLAAVGILLFVAAG